MPLASKQVTKPIAASIRIGGFSASGSSTAVTAAITTALTTAGSSGAPVPLQVSTSDSVLGVITTGNNRIEIADATSKAKLADAAGNEVYGRLTQATGVYTLSYFTLVSGTETAFSFASATNIDFEFNYRFSFATIPADFAIAVQSRNVQQDPASSGGRTQVDVLTIATLNTVPNLSRLPIAGSNVTLVVNGESFDSANGAITYSGQSVTWVLGVAGMPLDTTDRVIARYSTFS